MSKRQRVLLVAPGRGSYRPNTLGVLKNRSDAAQAIIDACDEYRVARGRPSVTELDASEDFKGKLHVAGENASLLTFACSLADAADLDPEQYEIAGVVGNSMGFYTALVLSGVLSLADGIELVETMAQYQVRNVQGGQVMYPIADANWRPDSNHLASIAATLEQATTEGHQAFWSIHLGSHAVLGADKNGVRFLLKNLPELEIGPRTFPIQLPLHSAFHTPILEQTSVTAKQELNHLQFKSPTTELIDGRGAVFRAQWSSPKSIQDYTLGEQVVDMYHFQKSLVTGLCHCAPDVVVALGPGNALGGPIARTIVQTGWHGLQDPAAFDARQKTQPALLSFGIKKQRDILLSGDA